MKKRFFVLLAGFMSLPVYAGSAEDIIEEANASIFEVYKNRFYRCGELVTDIAILSRSASTDRINPIDLMIDAVKRKNPDLSNDGKLMDLKAKFQEGKEERRKSFNGNIQELERHYGNAESVMTLYGLCLDMI